jgi:hypothetical protein
MHDTCPSPLEYEMVKGKPSKEVLRKYRVLLLAL